MRGGHDSYRDACRTSVRRHDPERYLACLFAPAARRDALFALLAANHEIAKTAEVVSEPMIGQIRLQWWRETIDGVEAGTPRDHEVAVPLAAAVSGGWLSLARLRAIVDAREADLDGEPPATLDDLEAYAETTAGGLHAAMAETLGADPEAAGEAGVGWGLIGLMRALPVLVAAGRAPLPVDLLEAAGLSHQIIKDRPQAKALAAAVRPVVERGRARLARAHSLGGFRDAAFRPLRLLADRAGDHAAALQRAGYEPFRASAPVTAGIAWRHLARMLGYRLGL